MCHNYWHPCILSMTPRPTYSNRVFCNNLNLRGLLKADSLQTLQGSLLCILLFSSSQIFSGVEVRELSWTCQKLNSVDHFCVDLDACFGSPSC